MARTARIVIPDLPHHITQRGNNRQDIFFTDDDRRFFLRTLAEHAECFGLTIHGYYLMTNHIHLIATTRQPVPFGTVTIYRHHHHALNWGQLP